MSKLVAFGFGALMLSCGGQAADDGYDRSRATSGPAGGSGGEIGEKLDDGPETGEAPSPQASVGPLEPNIPDDSTDDFDPAFCAPGEWADQAELQRRLATLYVGRDARELPKSLANLSADNPQSIARAVEYLLSDPGNRDGVIDHLAVWLGLGVNPVRDPTPLGTSLENATYQMLSTWVFERNGTLLGLFEGNSAWVNNEIGALYRLRPQPQEWTWVQLPPERNGGLLTQLHWLSVHPSASGRAAALLNLLGTPFPPPPAGLVNITPELAPDVSSREWLMTHQQDPACVSCHRLLDPLGFAFEHFDRDGVYRTVDGGKPVDASGMFTTGSGDETPFNNLDEMLARFRQAAPTKLPVSFARSVAPWFQASNAQDPLCLEAEALRLHESTGGNLMELYAQLPTTVFFRQK